MACRQETAGGTMQQTEESTSASLLKCCQHHNMSPGLEVLPSGSNAWQRDTQNPQLPLLLSHCTFCP